jgi:glycosyltransferase involved in cell wall biosynthesis
MKFTIGIPAFKAKFLKECIDSILAQSYSDFELIIINDASPENLDKIVNQYSDERISYYKNKKNIGAEHVVDNWNKCLSHAKGDFFILMGDDDKLEQEYLEYFYHLILEYSDLDIYHCRSYIINENSEKVDITSSWPKFESVYENIWHRINSLRQQYISDFVYRTSNLKKLGGFYNLPLAWSSDDISSYMVMRAKGIAHINIPLFCYRRNNLSISSGGNSRLKMNALNKEKEWLTDLLQYVPENKIDLIVYKSIKKELPKYFQKKRIHTIANSFYKNTLSHLYYWYKNKKKLGINNGEIPYALIEYMKRRYLNHSK